MGKKDSRHFTRAFKRNAAQMVVEKGMPVGRVAPELDIHPGCCTSGKGNIANGDDAFIDLAVPTGIEPVLLCS